MENKSDELVSHVEMKEYVIRRLSSSGEPKVNGMPNGSAGGHVKQNGSVTDNSFYFGQTNLPPVPSTKEDTPPPLPSNPPRLATTTMSTSRPSSGRPKERFIPEREVEIPASGCLYAFSSEDMSTFLRHMGVEERIVSHCYKKGLDGAKFSKLKDSDLEVLSMKNPIICHFRDKSVKVKVDKKRHQFMML